MQQFLLGYGPQQLPDRRRFDGARQQAQLIQQAFGIPQAPLGPLGHHMQGFWRDLDAFFLGNPAQMLLEGIEGNAPVVEALTAAEDRGQDPLRVGGRQDEDHPRGRLLQGLQQGVKGCGREHVTLVDDVDLPAGLNRGESRAFNQLADVVDPGVGGGVDLDDIEGIAVGNGGAELTAAAGLWGRVIRAEAVEGARQDAGAGGFPRSSGTTKEVGRRNATGAQGIAQGRGDRLLPHKLIKPLRAVLVVERLVGGRHRWRLLALDASVRV